MQRLIYSLLPAMALVTTAFAAPGDRAQAEIKDRAGNRLGLITLTETAQGLILGGELTGLSPGAHGFHIHAVGRCEPPFATAGGHFNPENRKHGFHDSAGSHSGDLPNVHASVDGKASAEHFASGLTLSGGSKSLLDTDGASVVFHAKADDYRTDPAGDSGDRIACGVLNSVD